MEMNNCCNVSLKHIALCTNKAANCLDTGPNETVAFGCSNSVALYQPLHWNKCKVAKTWTFNSHKGNILSLKWMKSFTNETACSKTNILLSGSVDKTIKCWIMKGSLFDVDLEEVMTLRSHGDAITGLDGICKDKSQNKNCKLYLIASTSADSTVKIWAGRGSLNLLECIQTVDFKYGFALNVTLHILPTCQVPVLVCPCDDFKIRVYAMRGQKEDESIYFDNVLTLQGHEDWVRSVDIITNANSELCMASCSQDSFIRLWKICKFQEVVDDHEESFEMKLKEQVFSVEANHIVSTFSARLDAVLTGHENWVYSVEWGKAGNSCTSEVLLSASIDKTIIVWEYDNISSVWVDKVRVGEVGGNTLGFYGAQFSQDGNHIISHSFSGALHGWDLTSDDNWAPAVLVSGHSSLVSDIDWEPQHGRYLLTTSEDQTTRLFSQWKLHDTWHEIARPQIHGYDIQCIGLINSGKFVSGADEKVLRVFDASSNFIINLKKLTNHDMTDIILEAPDGATVPALGLSNKAVFTDVEKVPSIQRSEQYIENLFTPIDLQQPPPETYLLQNTLWPESKKLYGHVYEIFCLACNHSGTLVASSAKSSQAKHSGVIIWHVETWQQLTTLYGHTLTVTQMEFSPNDQFLITVSRDRTWNLYKVAKTSHAYEFEAVARSEKSSCHSRIIWSCSWSYDSLYFATASRDKKIMMWKVKSKEEYSVERVSKEECGESVTAIAFSSAQSLPPTVLYLVGIGCESGLIKLYSFNDSQLQELTFFNKNLSHCLTVKRLRWKPQNDVNQPLCLASCSEDHQVKVFEITFL